MIQLTHPTDRIEVLVSRLTLSLVLTALVPAIMFAGEQIVGSGSMTIDGRNTKLVDAFAYTGELVEYDEDGKRRDNYEIVLTAANYDHREIAESTEPVSDFNSWLYADEPASLTLRLKSTLQSEFIQASLPAEYHSNPLRCHCDGVVSELKLENGRLKGRIYSPKGLKSRYEGEDDPSKGRTLAFDVTVDVPVVSIKP